MVASRTVLICAVTGSLVFNVGCSNIWYNLQPHRMWRLNSGPGPSMDPEFSTSKQKPRVGLVKTDAAQQLWKTSVDHAEIQIVRAQSQ